MAASDQDEHVIAAAGRSEQHRDATSSDSIPTTLSLPEDRQGRASTSSTGEVVLAETCRTPVQHSPARSDMTVGTQSSMAKIGPPVAPASFFWTLERSQRAVDVPIKDLYILCRLVVVVVILFRAGNVQYARVLGQFAIDLMGKDRWQERLPPYLSAQPEPDDDDAVYGLLEEAQRALKKVDVQNAAYLEGVMATMK